MTQKVFTWWKTGGQDVIAKMTVGRERTMFTPMGVKNGPVNGQFVGRNRVTKGIWTSTGEHFLIMDNWQRSKWAHRDLGETWIGETSFV